MDIKLSINRQTCIRCGHCVRVCPASIFIQPQEKGEIELQKIHNCIACGHCAAVCPTDSVIHSLFPPQKVHRIDRNTLPTPEQVLLLIRSRRSNRAFSAKPIPPQTLDLILEAGHRAPTASNLQQVEFTLITDPQKLQRISAFTIGKFAGLAKMLSRPVIKPLVKKFMPHIARYVPVFRKLKRDFETGTYDGVLRKATAVIFIHTPPKSTQYGSEDCNLAYQNASLMAESLGVSQFYTGFVLRAVKMDKKHKLAKSLGINGDIHAGMALAMPEFKYPNYIDKKDIRVNRD